MFKYYLVFLILSFYILHGIAQECEVTEERKPVAKEKRLKSDLLCNYNKHFVPLQNRSKVVPVYMAMQIFQYDIHDMTPKKLFLQTEITVKWKDAFLIWKPEEYDSITELVMSTDDIWCPDIMPEELEFFSRSSSILASTECKVTSSGNITCTVISSHNGFCNTDESRWPYEEYDCELQYMVWSYKGEQLQIDPPVNDTLTVRVSNKRPDWLITGRRTEFWTVRPQLSLMISEMYFEFKLVRNVDGEKMQFFFLSIFVMTSLSLLTFCTNFEATERLMLCLINILYHILQIQDMEWHFPSLGHTVPYLLCFYRDSMVFSLILLIESMVFKKILTSDKQTPSWIVTFERTIGRRAIGKLLLVDGINAGETKNTEGGSFEDDLKFIQQSNQLEKRRTIQILDRIFLIVFLLAYFIMIMILLTY